MRPVDTARKGTYKLLRITAILVSLLLATACGAKEQQQPPTSTPTLPAVATATPPVPTATAVPTSTDTPLPPVDTPTATTTPVPTSVPTDMPAPTALPTDTPTVTPVPLLEVSEARVIYHDGEALNDVGRYESGVQPWLDLLVRMGDNWYGPERQEDDIDALPLPEGYRWETEGSFSSSPDGQAWWTAPGVVGQARLIGPDGSVLYTLELQIEFY